MGKGLFLLLFRCFGHFLSMEFPLIDRVHIFSLSLKLTTMFKYDLKQHYAVTEQGQPRYWTGAAELYNSKRESNPQ